MKTINLLPGKSFWEARFLPMLIGLAALNARQSIAEILDAELQFRCLDANDPELRRPTMSSEPSVKIKVE